MFRGRASVDWRRVAAVALLVVAACLAVALVPHAVGGFGGNVVVTQTGPPPSVNADLGNPRQRFQNRVTNQITDFVPLLVPALASLAAFAAARPRGTDESTARARALTDAVGAFAGGALGYVVFVGVASLAYGEVPGGYLLESYPPVLRGRALLVNAIALGATSALGAGLAGAATGADDREEATN